MKINAKKEEERIAKLEAAEAHKCPPGTRLMGKVEQQEMLDDLRLSERDVEN